MIAALLLWQPCSAAVSRPQDSNQDQSWVRHSEKKKKNDTLSSWRQYQILYNTTVKANSQLHRYN